MNIDYKDKKAAVIGGDCRQIYCAKRLSEKGFETALYGFDFCQDDIGICTRCKDLSDALNKADIVVLPMPLTRDGVNLSVHYNLSTIPLADLFRSIDKYSIVFGGSITDEVKKLAKTYGVKLVDYLDREELAVANAYLTAESAVAIAMNELDFSLTDYPVLVMGYGRIGKCLCRILKGCGANVYASARKRSDFEWIRAFGYSPVDTSKVSEVVSSCRLIYNTIPEMIVDENVLRYVNKDSIIIDLASKPGGIDFDSAKKQGVKVIWALSLPGKKMKVSAGNAIAETVINILEDEGAI